MNRPETICESCFERNRVTHDAGDGSELTGVYCTHSHTGAFIERHGEQTFEWKTMKVQESDFWVPLRIAARLARGEISTFQASREILASALKNHQRWPA